MLGRYRGGITHCDLEIASFTGYSELSDFGKESGTGTVLREYVNRGRAMGEAAWMERVVKKPDLQTQVKPYLSRFLAQRGSPVALH